jgi:hypothetical protein
VVIVMAMSFPWCHSPCLFVRLSGRFPANVILF